MITLYELMEMIPETFEPRFTARLNELYYFLRQQKRRLSEKEAAFKFLKSSGKSKYFNKLKNDLKRELVRVLMHHLPVWMNPEQPKRDQECYKEFAAYKILLLNGKRKLAIDIAKDLLPELRKCELYSPAYTVATDLRFHYSSMKISKSLTEKYDALCQELLDILNVEGLVRKLHSRIALIGNTRESYSTEIIEEMKMATEIVLPLRSYNSHYLNRFIYAIIINRYIVVFNYEKIIHYCDEALASFPKGHVNGNALKFAYMQRKLPALIATGKLEEAKKISKEACKLMIGREGSFNWNLAFIRRITVCLYQSEYQEAYDLYKAHHKYDCPYPILNEYWKILWGYDLQELSDDCYNDAISSYNTGTAVNIAILAACCATSPIC